MHGLCFEDTAVEHWHVMLPKRARVHLSLQRVDTVWCPTSVMQMQHVSINSDVKRMPYTRDMTMVASARSRQTIEEAQHNRRQADTNIEAPQCNAQCMYAAGSCYYERQSVIVHQKTHGMGEAHSLRGRTRRNACSTRRPACSVGCFACLE